MYKYELHCHTSEISKCAKICASDMVDFYKSQNYTGLIITDHFLNGNTNVPSDEKWENRVKMFCEGYRKAKERGDQIGIDVFFGWEFTIPHGNDFLTYGLDEEWLLNHENCDLLHINDYYDLVHKDGGFIVHAHPFREAFYIDMIRLAPRKVDAVEVFNACRTDFENKMADIYAQSYCLPPSCGTDNHVGMRESLAAYEIDFRAENINQIIKTITDRTGKIEIITPNEGK